VHAHVDMTVTRQEILGRPEFASVRRMVSRAAYNHQLHTYERQRSRPAGLGLGIRPLPPIYDAGGPIRGGSLTSQLSFSSGRSRSGDVGRVGTGRSVPRLLSELNEDEEDEEEEWDATRNGHFGCEEGPGCDDEVKAATKAALEAAAGARRRRQRRPASDKSRVSRRAHSFPALPCLLPLQRSLHS
jgi:hypothetical protein